MNESTECIYEEKILPVSETITVLEHSYELCPYGEANVSLDI